MKSLRAILALSILLLFGSSSFAQSVKMDASKKMPYTAVYSSDFKMGNQAQAKKVLEIWKDWDDNQLDRHDYFADSLKMFFADGTTLQGKEAAMSASKAYRNSLGNVKSQIHAWVPIHSNDKNEDIVLVWGDEERTSADGKVETVGLHEVWWFNKNGKVTAMRQWTARFGVL
jgi:hypothetical protein